MMEQFTRKEAKQAGETRYNGKVCEKHPHAGGLRYLDGSCPECKSANTKKWYLDNKDKKRITNKIWESENPELVADKNRRYREKNADKRSESFKKWYHRNHEVNVAKMVARNTSRMSRDPVARLANSLRGLIRMSIKARGYSKNSKTEQILGCDWLTVKTHLESKFTDGMSWGNRNLWHIDHIVPLSSARTEEELIKLCHHSNLQPLWASDNIRKSDKMSLRS